MMMVEIGSSRGSAARPKLPPTPPDTEAKALCSRREPACGSWRIVRSATARAALSPFVVAAAIALAAPSGNAFVISSIGLPAMLLRRAAKPGCSSAKTALRNALMSSSVMPARPT
jgi:hypothetical protein